jgi:hypothetical protein
MLAFFIGGCSEDRHRAPPPCRIHIIDDDGLQVELWVTADMIEASVSVSQLRATLGDCSMVLRSRSMSAHVGKGLAGGAASAQFSLSLSLSLSISLLRLSAMRKWN